MNNDSSSVLKDVRPSVARFNQHFLIDESVLDSIVANSGVESDDLVLEVGPGRGDLTKRLVEVARKVVAIEYDSRLVEGLRLMAQDYDNLEIVHADALKTRFPKNIGHIVANIPFNITEPLIKRMLQESFTSATLLVGETYAKNAMSHRPDTRLGLITRAYFKVDPVIDVPSSCFDPEPSTDCSVITLTPQTKKALTGDFGLYMVRSIWDQKSRPLGDALKSGISQYAVSKGGETIDGASFLKQLSKHYSHTLNTRVDNVTNPEFIDLYEALSIVKLKHLFGGHKPRGGARNWRVQYERFLPDDS